MDTSITAILVCAAVQGTVFKQFSLRSKSSGLQQSTILYYLKCLASSLEQGCKRQLNKSSSPHPPLGTLLKPNSTPTFYTFEYGSLCRNLKVLKMKSLLRTIIVLWAVKKITPLEDKHFILFTLIFTNKRLYQSSYMNHKRK